MEADEGKLVDESLDDDTDFVPTAEMYIHGDIDDEQTINEEELLEDEGQPEEEIDDLMKEKDMPLEQLLALYGYQIPQGGVADGEKDVPSPREAGSAEQVALGDAIKEEEEEALRKQGKEMTEEKAVLQEAGGVVGGVTGEEVGMAGNGEEDGWAEVRRSKKDHDSHAPRRSMRLFGSSAGIERYLYRESDSEDDSDYEPEHWKKEINVGADYQAEVPDCTFDAVNPEGDEEEVDQCLWKPDMLNEKQVRNFLLAVRKGRMSRSSYASNSPLATRDDEQALYVLQRNEYDPSKALQLIQTSDAFVTEAIRPWSEQECIQFEYGLRNHGKNFFAIQREGIPTRSVKEVVQFYYIWKKTERRDLFLQQFRFGKRKAAQMAQLSDYMDRFLDDEDSRSSLSSSLSSWSRDPPLPPPAKELDRQALVREKEGPPSMPRPPSSVEAVAPPQPA